MGLYFIHVFDFDFKYIKVQRLFFLQRDKYIKYFAYSKMKFKGFGNFCSL